MAKKAYNLEQTGDQVQAALNKVINLVPATEEAAGLMSAADKEKLNGLPTGANIQSSLGEKVDKVTGKGLSTNDYDDSEKSKVASAYQKPNTGIPKDDLSDGVKASLGNADSASQDVAEIKTKIPSQASDQNQLADKNFVNSSIATATADFKGTYDSLSELQAVTADKNDYGYVVSTDQAGNTVYSRYKYDGSAWVFEYDLNNSSFTAAEWASIQSQITSALVQKLSALPTNQELSQSLSGKQDTISDLAAIRSGAAAGATAYQKPGTGIPKTDLDSAVKHTLDLADSSVQAAPAGPLLPPPESDDFATKTSVDELEAKVTETDANVRTIPMTKATMVGRVFVSTKVKDTNASYTTLKINIHKGDEITAYLNMPSTGAYAISVWDANDSFLDGVAGDGYATADFYKLIVADASASYALITNCNAYLSDASAYVHILSDVFQKDVLKVMDQTIAKVNDIEDNIENEIEPKINTLYGKETPISVNRNIGSLNADGTATSQSSTSYAYRYSDFIPVENTKKYKVIGYAGSDPVRVLAGYSSNDESTYIANGIDYTPVYGAKQEITFICPPEVKYIRIGYNTAILSDDDQICFLVSDGKVAKDTIGEKIQCTWNTGFINPDGTVNASGNHRYSSFIPVVPGETYYFVGSQGSYNRPILSLYSTNNLSSICRIIADGQTREEGFFVCPDGCRYAVVVTAPVLVSTDDAGLYSVQKSMVTDAIPNKDKLLEIEGVGYGLQYRNREVSYGYRGKRRPLIGFIFDGDYDLNDTLSSIINLHGYNVGFAPGYDNLFHANYLPVYHKWMERGDEILIHGNTDLSNSTPLSDSEVESRIKSAYDTCKLYGFEGKGYVVLNGSCADRFIPMIAKYFDYACTQGNKYGQDTPQYLQFGTDSPYKLWRYGLQNSTLAEMKQAVDDVIASGGLLLFYTHANSQSIGYSTAENITSLIYYIDAKVANGEVQVKTPIECIRDFYTIRYEDL